MQLAGQRIHRNGKSRRCNRLGHSRGNRPFRRAVTVAETPARGPIGTAIMTVGRGFDVHSGGCKVALRFSGTCHPHSPVTRRRIASGRFGGHNGVFDVMSGKKSWLRSCGFPHGAIPPDVERIPQWTTPPIPRPTRLPSQSGQPPGTEPELVRACSPESECSTCIHTSSSLKARTGS